MSAWQLVLCLQVSPAHNDDAARRNNRHELPVITLVLRLAIGMISATNCAPGGSIGWSVTSPGSPVPGFTALLTLGYANAVRPWVDNTFIHYYLPSHA